MVYTVVFALLGIFWVGNTAAEGITDNDFRYLPSYCKSRFNRGADWEYWNGIFGSTWIHIHHYCIGLRALQKSWAALGDEGARSFQLQRAERNFQYVLNVATRDFVIYPELELKMGEVQEQLGRGGEAVKFYSSAIRRKPDYAPAYGALSAYYESVGDLDEAKKVIEKGLSQNPSSKSLKRRAAELGL